MDLYKIPELIPYRTKGEWGYCDKYKNVIIDCIYSLANPYEDGVAEVRLKNRSFFIDDLGKNYGNFSFERNLFEEGVAPFCLFEKYGFIDKKGRIVLDCIYDEASDFYRKLALVRLGDNSYYIDRNGITKFNRKYYDRIYQYQDGFAKIYSNKGFGFVDDSGNTIVNCVHSEITYNEGMFLYRKNDNCNYGYLNNEGVRSIKPIFEKAFNFQGGTALVKQNGKWTFIDKSGECIGHIKYEEAKPFKEELAPVKINDTWGFINSKGVIVIDFEYQDANQFNEGLASVRKNNRWMIIDRFGNVITSNLTHEPSPFKDGITIIDDGGGNCSFYNKEGQKILDYVNNDYDFRDKWTLSLGIINGLIEVNVVSKWGRNKIGYIDKLGNKYWEEK